MTKAILVAMLVCAATPALADEGGTDLAPFSPPILLRPPDLAPPELKPPERPEPKLNVELLAVRADLYEVDSKSVLAAAVLELLTPVPGVGQMYAHSQWWKVLIQYGILAVGGLLSQENFAPLAAAAVVDKTWAVTDAVLAAHRFNSDLKVHLGLVPEDWPLEESWR